MHRVWLRIGILAAGIVAFGGGAGAQTVLSKQWTYGPIWSVATSIAYSPDGQSLAVAGQTGVQLYDAATGKRTKCIPTSAFLGVNGLAFSPDSRSLAVGGQNLHGVLELWNVSTGKLEWSMSNSSAYAAIDAVAFSPDGKTLATSGLVGGPSVLTTWDAVTGRQTGQRLTTDNWIVSIAFSPDGKTLADCGQGVDYLGEWSSGVAEIWQLSSGKRLFSLPTIALQAESVAFSPDGSKLALGGYSPARLVGAEADDLEIWNPSTGTLIARWENQAGSAIESVAFSSDGRRLAAGGYVYGGTSSIHGSVGLWDVSTGTIIDHIANSATEIHAVAFPPSRPQIAVAGLIESGQPLAFPVPDAEILNLSAGALPVKLNAAIYRQPGAVVFSPDGQTLAQAASGGQVSPATNAFEGQLNIWDAKTGTLRRSLPSEANQGLSAIAYSSDGKRIATGGRAYNAADQTYFATVEIWDPATGQRTATIPTQSGNFISVLQFSPDGKTLAVAGYQLNAAQNEYVSGLELWNLTTGKRTATLDTQANVWIGGLAFTPDGKTLAVGGNGYEDGGIVEFWNVSSATRRIGVNPTTSTVTAIAMSPDGKTLAAAGWISSNFANGSAIDVWDVKSGNRIAVTEIGGSEGVQSVAYSPHGGVLYAGTSTSVQAFETKSYSTLGVFPENMTVNGVDSVCICPNGNLMAYIAYTAIVVASTPFKG